MKTVAFLLTFFLLLMTNVFAQQRFHFSESRLAIFSQEIKEVEANVLKVFVGDQLPSSDVPSVLGEVFLEKDSVVFRPTFPFRKGQSYVAVFQDTEMFTFQI